MGCVDIVRLEENRERCRRFVFGAAYARLPGTAHWLGGVQIIKLTYLPTFTYGVRTHSFDYLTHVLVEIMFIIQTTLNPLMMMTMMMMMIERKCRSVHVQ